jgi:hypothetical protein
VSDRSGLFRILLLKKSFVFLLFNSYFMMYNLIQYFKVGGVSDILFMEVFMLANFGFITAIPANVRHTIMAVLFLPLVAYGQIDNVVNVIRITGNTALISEGTADGIKKGDKVKISRLINGGWLEIAAADVIEATYNQATIQVAEGSQALKLGDKAERIAPIPAEKRKKTAAENPSPKQTQPAVKKQENVSRPAETTSRATRASSRQPAQSIVYQDNKRVYLGPQIGAFIPVGDMADVFESTFAYGGVLGVQFRKNMDVCMQFFFAAKKDEWSFWNLQLLGRRYLNQNFIFDFGYGISYPEFILKGFPGGGGNIQLGLSAGMTYRVPLNNDVSFELGILYQYYPSFGEKAGQFFNVQGRLFL